MKILVVGDNKRVVKFLKQGLEEEEYEVEVVHDVDEGFRWIATGSYDLVILDALPGRKDAITLVRDLRAKDILTPVLMLSVKGTVEDIVAGLDAGADVYMKKPFAFAELLARVKALQRRTEFKRGAKIIYADLCLYPEARKAWRNEKRIDLTATECNLLELFMRNPNQVLTCDIIASAIWGDASGRFRNVIYLYIKYLRKKVDQGFDKKLIHNVWGAGYILRKMRMSGQ